MKLKVAESVYVCPAEQILQQSFECSRCDNNVIVFGLPKTSASIGTSGVSDDEYT